MKTVRNIALALAAAGGLALGGVTLAEEAKQPEGAGKPPAESHQHRGEQGARHGGQHAGQHGQHGMERMQAMHAERMQGPHEHHESHEKESR